MKHPLIYLILGTLAALVLSLFLVIVGMNIVGMEVPVKDLQQLVLFMFLSGIGTITTVYLLYHFVLMNWVNSLRWSLIITVITSVILIFVNVWVTAQLMFINLHDLILTAALLVFGGLTAIVFGLFIANTISQKIEIISAAIERVAGGDLKIRVEARGDDEFSKLGQMLNWMVDNLQEIEQEKQKVEQTRRDLVAWLSHDLRTPLTAVQASLEAIADGIVTDEETSMSYINNSLLELEHLRVLLDDLFAIAQLDAGHMNLNFVKASLSDLISDIVASMNARANNRKVTIKGDIQPSIDPVILAPDKMQRVLYNLIDNALRHTPPDGTITIRAYPETDRVRVDVHNTGSSINSEHLPHIFEKFYRGEAARHQGNDGHRSSGLGLAIARGFIEAHKGTIWVDSQEQQGTRFSFSIPRNSIRTSV
jgi:two-component system, OmpR family, sensor histidine kinase SaeS